MLYQGDRAIDHLDDYEPAWLPSTHKVVEMAIVYEDSKGVKRVKGGADLKGSQSYPLG